MYTLLLPSKQKRHKNNTSYYCLTVDYGIDRLILSDHLQYKRQHMPVSNTTHLANRHKQRTG